MSYFLYSLKHDLRRWKEDTIQSIAWMMPKTLAYWCFIRLVAHATTGQWGNETPSGMNWEKILERWNVPHEKPRGLTREDILKAKAVLDQGAVEGSGL